MSNDIPDGVAGVFETASAFERTDDGFQSTTTPFEAAVTVTEGSTDWKHRYVVTIAVPGLDSATVDPVAEIVVTDWFETLERRLEAAPGATRASVELTEFAVERVDKAVHVEYVFEWGNPDSGVEIARTLIEYVEGTYVEGIIPGYDYQPPVSDLLSNASQSGESGTPL